MRLILGLASPVVLLIAGYLLRGAGQQLMAGFYFIAGLLIVGSLTGALLGSKWAIPYVACLVAGFLVLLVSFEVGGTSTGRDEDSTLLVYWIAAYAALGGFGAAVGVEAGRQDLRKRG